MPNSTRSNKEHTLLFSDPTLLERTIRKSKRTALIDNNACSSTDTRLPPSIETTLPLTAHTHPTSIDTPPWTSIDTKPRNMVATLVLIQDATGNLHDQEGHLRNAADQKIDDQGAVIPDNDADIAAAQAVDEAARTKTLADYNRPYQYYENRSAIRPPAIQRQDFKLKPQYFTLVGQRPYCGLSHEHPMDHLERFEDLVSPIKANGVPEDYLFSKLFKYSLAGEASYWLK
ncbi:uncharacterized protein LOC106446274 isoform X2 [Brassica napus]|uniref:uncharacterized protein LOC106446274 isoform X2 n=1 Tax=Brassica napus TaxID=3708 RepID=UPI0006AA8F63|nr:uncharacterized protein LOC106446274 isoform X2 [Brassica napus]